MSSNLLAESILENKAIDDSYFGYLEEENYELKVNELIWHLGEKYLNDDSESDSLSQHGDEESLERKSVKSEEDEPKKEEEEEQS